MYFGLYLTNSDPGFIGAFDTDLSIFSSLYKIFFCLAGLSINGSVGSLTFLLKNHV